MGAWGIGIFENDMSCDLIYEAMETDAATFINRSINGINQEYLESDEGYEIILSGAILDSILNGTKYENHTEGLDLWLAQQNPESVKKFKPDIVEGLQVVLSNISELNQLWEENETDYPMWKSSIENIMVNLGGEKR